LKDKVSFGIIGTAHHHSKLFARAIRNNPRAQLVGVYDDDENRAKGFAEEFDIDFFNNLDEFIDLEGLDAGVITTENNKKKEVAIILAKSMKHVLCDKPLGLDVLESKEIIQACKKNKVKLQVGFVARYSEEAIEARKTLSSGKIGGVKYLAIENRVDSGTVKTLSPWLMKRKLSGGGAILEHSVHAADIARFLIGREATSVYAVSSPNLDPAFEGEDNFTILVEFENGAMATIDGSYCRPSSFRPIDMIGRVIGTKGELYFSIGNQVVISSTGVEPDVKLGIHPTGLRDWYEGTAAWNMVNDMINCIKSGREPIADGESGKRINELVEASYNSLKTGKTVLLQSTK
jgi:predicted dehydrogenase